MPTLLSILRLRLCQSVADSRPLRNVPAALRRCVPQPGAYSWSFPTHAKRRLARGTLMLAVFGLSVMPQPTAHAQATSGSVAAALQIAVIAGGGSTVPSMTPVAATNAMIDPNAVILDSAGNIYISDNQNNLVEKLTVSTGQIAVIAGGGTTTPSTTPTAATNARLSTPDGLALDSAGNLYIADWGTNLLVKLTASTFLPTTAVASTSASQNVLVKLTAASTISSVSMPKAQNGVQEFTVGTVTGCATGGITSNATGTICTVPITFNPQYPGPRTGALTLNSSATTVLGTVGLSGIGTGPLGVFQPGTSSVVSTGGLMPTTISPQGIAIDNAGSVYIADYFYSRIVKVTAADVVSVLNVGSPGGQALNNPVSVAVNSAGDIYIADYNNSRIVELSAEGAASVVSIGTPGGKSLNGPSGVTVDTIGNVYIADWGNNRIVEVSAGGVASVLNVGTPEGAALNGPNGMAVDTAGDIYIADTQNNRIVEVTTAGVASVVSTGTMTLNVPTGVTVNAAGDVYIADASDRIIEANIAGVADVVNMGSLTLNNPAGVAVDDAGSLYIADTTNHRVVQVNQTTTPALSFASTAVGDTSPQQTVAVQNIGNMPLAFTALAATANFNLGGNTSTCTGTTSLTAGTTCDLGVEFAPTAIGALAGTVNITDNSLNVATTIQQLSLSGTGTAPAPPAPSYTLTASPASLTIAAGQTGTTTLTFTPVGGYTGSVTLSCGTLPSFTKCAFTQGGTANSTVAMTGNDAVISVVLTISTNVATALNVMPSILQTPTSRPATLLAAASTTPSPLNPILSALAFWGPGGLAGLAAFGGKRKLTKKQFGFLQLCLLVLLTGALAAGLSGCGGSSSTPASTSNTSVTPAGTSAVIITAAPNSGTAQTLNLTVTITG